MDTLSKRLKELDEEYNVVDAKATEAWKAWLSTTGEQQRASLEKKCQELVEQRNAIETRIAKLEAQLGPGVHNSLLALKLSVSRIFLS